MVKLRGDYINSRPEPVRINTGSAVILVTWPKGHPRCRARIHRPPVNRQVTTGRLLFALKIPAAAVSVDDFHGLPRRFNCPVSQ